MHGVTGIKSWTQTRIETNANAQHNTEGKLDKKLHICNLCELTETPLLRT
jgi:hypothetical protein